MNASARKLLRPLSTCRIRSVRLMAIVLASAACPSTFAEEINFTRDIRPILSSACYRCHGFDENSREADLRLDSVTDAARVLDSVVPAENTLWQRIMATDADVVMPPPEEVRQLSNQERDLIREWIEQGGQVESHWSLEPIANPEPPNLEIAASSTPNNVLNASVSSWNKSPVDQFLWTELTTRGLVPQPEADRETLIRRVAFTLTGLPPTTAELDEYLLDTNPDSYERMVNRYLDSPAYGEEMARHWLDVARYGDTHGLHLDNVRQIWPYRDWVINAFNRNQPFDEFTIDQLAGDLRPEATRDQLVATGFNRCNVTTSEGGAIAEEWLYRYAVDRASTTFQTWLGLTGGCAVCHDHKYDPISAREFYSFYAFFYSAADPAMDGNREDTPPYLQLPSPEQTSELETLKLVQAETERRWQLAASDAAAKWDGGATATQNMETSTAVYDLWLDDYIPAGASANNPSRNAETWMTSSEMEVPLGIRALHQRYGHFHDQKISDGLVPRTIPESPEVEVWIHVDDLHPPQAVMLELETSEGRRRFGWGDVAQLGRGAFADRNNVRIDDMPTAGEWSKLTIDASHLGLKPGALVNAFTLAQFGGACSWDALAVRGSQPASTDPRQSFEAWREYCQGKSTPVLPKSVSEWLKNPPADSENTEDSDNIQAEESSDTEGMLFQARTQFLKHIARNVPPAIARQRAAASKTQAQRLAVEDAIPGTMVYGELEQPRAAFVMTRGQYDAPGEAVEPSVLECLPPIERKTSATGTVERLSRLDLANWLVNDANPLTARVTVNRFWQQVFGAGIVETSDDFGTQGKPPTHPELLDWLAHDFRSSGWDIKRLMRTLVTSAAFRQNATSSDRTREIDPTNRYLARGPRIRLDAEQIRDAALATSGLLNRRLGGPGFLAYQPPNIWEPVGYGNSNTRYYLRDGGQDLYRRSLYSFVKRTAPPPFMSNFDAPNREMFCTKRQRSNTPLQALQLMNDVQHIEAARSLAEQVLKQSANGSSERLDAMFRQVLARYPDAIERSSLAATLQQFEQRFAEDVPAAEALISAGEWPATELFPPTELAAYTLLANLILNLDEAVTRN